MTCIENCKIWIANNEEKDLLAEFLKDKFPSRVYDYSFSSGGYIRISIKRLHFSCVDKYNNDLETRNIANKEQPNDPWFSVNEFLSKYQGENMNLQQAYQVMQENCGIEVGDRVKVLRKARDYENGWDKSWAVCLNIFVGKEYTVSSIHEKAGMFLQGYYLPFFILELIEKAKPKIFIGKDEVIFDQDNKIQIGCTDVSFETCLKIAERIHEIQGNK